jgi:hypothetical protein
MRDVHVDGAGHQAVGGEYVGRTLLGVRHRPPAVEGAVDGDVAERVEVGVLQAVRVEHQVVLAPSGAVGGGPVPGLVPEAGAFRRCVVVPAEQRAGQADGSAGADARGRSRPGGGVDEVRRTAPVVHPEGVRRGQRPDPVRHLHAHWLGHSGIV